MKILKRYRKIVVLWGGQMLNALRKPMKLYQIEYRENSYKEQEKVGESLIEEIPVSIAFNGYTKY